MRNELVDDLTLFENRLDGARSADEKVLLQIAIRDTNEEIAGVDRHIERLIGEPPNLGTNAASDV